MKSLVFSPAAQADIDGIWDYSADNWGPDQGSRLEIIRVLHSRMDVDQRL